MKPPCMVTTVTARTNGWRTPARWMSLFKTLIKQTKSYKKCKCTSVQEKKKTETEVTFSVQQRQQEAGGIEKDLEPKTRSGNLHSWGVISKWSWTLVYSRRKTWTADRENRENSRVLPQETEFSDFTKRSSPERQETVSETQAALTVRYHGNRLPTGPGGDRV